MEQLLSKEELLEKIKESLSKVASEKFRRTFIKLLENAQNRKHRNSNLYNA